MSATNDLLYQISLCHVPHIGAVHAKILCETFGSALDVFRAPRALLEKIEGIGEVRAARIHHFKEFYKAEREMAFIEKFGIDALFYRDPKFPQRLKNCYDPPVLLYFKGDVDLNTTRIVAVVGTRRNSVYGQDFTEELIRVLCENRVLIVSGLAFGIDAIAHRAALKNAGRTLAVIGHGLDTIYPAANTGLAREMIHTGGILTEFKSNTKPDKHNFPSRNRIVAGMSDATIVVESHKKGGSMITADLAYGYNREVFAVPGRATDSRSSGCNELIRSNKAILLQHPVELLDAMNWSSKNDKINPQISIFAELSDIERVVVQTLEQRHSVHVDELKISSGLSPGLLATLLITLEMRNVIRALPGRRYTLRSRVF